MLRFVDVTDNLDLMIEPVDNNQPIMDSKDGKMRKQNKRAGKKKAQLDSLSAPVWNLIASSATFLLFCVTLICCFGSPALLSSCFGSSTCLSPFFACLETPIALSSRFLPTLILGSSAILLPFFMLSAASCHLASIALKTLK